MPWRTLSPLTRRFRRCRCFSWQRLPDSRRWRWRWRWAAAYGKATGRWRRWSLVFWFWLQRLAVWFAGIIKRNMEKAFDGSNISKQAGERIVLPVFCAGFWMILADFCFSIAIVQCWHFWFAGITNRNMKNVFDGSNILQTGRRKNRAACFCAGFWMILADFCFSIGEVQRWYSWFAGIIKKHRKRIWQAQTGRRKNRAACFCAAFWMILADFSHFNRSCAVLAV